MTRLRIEEEYAAPYEVEVEHEELPGGAVLLRAAFDDGQLLLPLSPAERREWGSLAWKVGEAVDAWYLENDGHPFCFTQNGLRYQLQSYARDSAWINEKPVYR